MRDALPLLKMASRVTIVEIADVDDVVTAQARADDVAAWLGGHGIKSAGHGAPSASDDPATLEAIVRKERADLIVAGAYGHSRMREWAFGGVTHSILQGEHCALLSH